MFRKVLRKWSYTVNNIRKIMVEYWTVKHEKIICPLQFYVYSDANFFSGMKLTSSGNPVPSKSATGRRASAATALTSSSPSWRPFKIQGNTLGKSSKPNKNKKPADAKKSISSLKEAMWYFATENYKIRITESIGLKKDSCSVVFNWNHFQP